MSGTRFVRFYPSDWRSGCIGLTLEQEGLYVRVCAFIYESNRRLPFDDSHAAKVMGCHTNAYRKVRDQLVAIGKLVEREDGYSVPRAEKELAAAANAQGEKARQADQASGRDTGKDTVGDTRQDTPTDTPIEFSENANEINGPLKSLNELSRIGKESINNNSVSHSVAARSGRAVPSVDMDRLIQACNGALDNPVNCQGLLTAATPIMWLESGCDMDRDIIPTLEAIGRKRHGARIRSWEYFSQPIADARDKRLRGMPEPSAASGTGGSYADERIRKAREALELINGRAN